MKYHFALSPYTQLRVIEGISVTRGGRIGLSKFFLARHGIARDARAHLYWDADRRIVAIAFTDDADARAYPVLFSRHHGGFINARRFFSANQLNPVEHKGRYSYEVVRGETIGIGEAKSDVFLMHLQ